MNPEPPMYVRHTLLDLVRFSGMHGTIAVILSLVLCSAGIALIFMRPNLRLCIAYFVSCLLPSVSGVTGFATSAMGAFATLGISGAGDSLKLFAALGEIVLPMMFGFIGSGLALMIAALVWIRAEKEAPPPLPN